MGPKPLTCSVLVYDDATNEWRHCERRPRHIVAARWYCILHAHQRGLVHHNRKMAVPVLNGGGPNV